MFTDKGLTIIEINTKIHRCLHSGQQSSTTNLSLITFYVCWYDLHLFNLF